MNGQLLFVLPECPIYLQNQKMPLVPIIPKSGQNSVTYNPVRQFRQNVNHVKKN